MKNLKKILALVLAFACAFSMFAVAGAIDFKDKNDIKAFEAVNTLVSLGVLKGDENGNFRPNDTVTRAEMAKMIFVIWNNGKEDATAYSTMKSQFSDVEAGRNDSSINWAIGYINFCAANKIIAGRGDGTFGPKETVTGQEAAKMLLILMGYDEVNAGLTGANWRQNTMSYASLANLFEKVDTPVEQGMPRQYAAQMVYNTLEANRVKWSNDTRSYDEITQWIGNGFHKETVGYKYMFYRTITGILLEANNGEGKGFTLLEKPTNGIYSWSDGYVWTETKYETDLSQYLGEEVKVSYNADAYSKNQKDAVFGVYSTENNTVLRTTANKIADAKESGKIKVNDVKYKFAGDSRYYVAKEDGVLAVNGRATNLNRDADGTIASIPYEPQMANDVKLIDYDDDGKLDIAIRYPLAVAKVASVTSTSLNLKDTMGDDETTTSPKLDDIVCYDGIKKDDLITLTWNPFLDKMVVQKAVSTEEKIGAVRNAVNGTNEEYNISTGWSKRYNGDNRRVDSKLKSGDEATMVVIAGIVYYVDRTASGTGNDVVVVVNTGYGGGGADSDYVEAKLMYGDGKTQTVKVNAVINNTATDNDKYDLDEIGTEGKNADNTEDLDVLNSYLAGNTIKNNKIDIGVKSGNKTYYDYNDILRNTEISPALVTYSRTSDGYTLQLLDQDENDAGYDKVYRNGVDGKEILFESNGSNDAKINGVAFADDAVVYVVYKNSDVKKYTGRQAKKLDIDAPAHAVAEANGGINRIKVAAVYEDYEPEISDTGTYAYVLDTTSSNSLDGTSYIILTVYGNEGKETLYAEKNRSDRTRYEKGDIISMSYTDKKIKDGDTEYKLVEDVEKMDAVVGAITGWDRGDITILNVEGETVSYDVDVNDTTVLIVDTDAKEGISVGTADLTEAIELTDNVYRTNVKYYHSTGDEFDVIVMDQPGNWLAQDAAVGTDPAAALSHRDVKDVYVSTNQINAIENVWEVEPSNTRKTLHIAASLNRYDDPIELDLSKIRGAGSGNTATVVEFDSKCVYDEDKGVGWFITGYSTDADGKITYTPVEKQEEISGETYTWKGGDVNRFVLNK